MSDIPTWNGAPITPGWWWLQFSDMPGPRYWDGTFWKQGSYFSAAEDYAEFAILGPAVPPGNHKPRVVLLNDDKVATLITMFRPALVHFWGEARTVRDWSKDEMRDLGAMFERQAKAIQTLHDRVTMPEPFDRASFNVLAAQAYGWTVTRNGELAALVAGDMGYEDAGISLGMLVAEALVKNPCMRQQIGDALMQLVTLCQQALCHDA